MTMIKNRSSLAMMAALVMASAAAVPGPSGITRTSARPRRRLPTAIDSAATELQREIAEWNASVERRKAEKKLGRSA